jgi:hypothetical protein
MNTGLGHLNFGVLAKSYNTLEELVKNFPDQIKLNVPETLIGSYEQ